MCVYVVLVINVYYLLRRSGLVSFLLQCRGWSLNIRMVYCDIYLARKRVINVIHFVLSVTNILLFDYCNDVSMCPFL